MLNMRREKEPFPRRCFFKGPLIRSRVLRPAVEQA